MMLTIFLISGVLLSFSAVAQAKVQFLGVAIAGGDFGCQIDGTCPTGSAQLPLSSLGGADGLGQMNHFVQNDGVNIFRLPTSWQFLTNSNESGDLDSKNAAKYDQLVQACLGTGAYCIIDLHNFARFNGAIIGQGGPSNDQFAHLWAQLAVKYATDDHVIFELMNEPHDLDMTAWAQTCQSAVTAIRSTGAATSQIILLPGTNFDSAATLVSSGSADLLLGVTNPNGSTAGLLLDVHKYLDVDNSGTHAQCVTDNVGNFSALATYLRGKGRQALVSETGAAPGQASCLEDFCSQNAFINANPDVFVGLVAWAAGGFDSSYVLSLTPSKSTSGGSSALVDNQLFSQCVLGAWLNATTVSTGMKGMPSEPHWSFPSSPSSSGGANTQWGSYTLTLTAASSMAPSTLVTAGGMPTPAATGSGDDGFQSLFGAPTSTVDTSGGLATAQLPVQTTSAGATSRMVMPGQLRLLAGMLVIAIVRFYRT